MKLILKIINWVNKRRLIKLEKKCKEIIQNDDAKKRVLMLGVLLEKELKDNWGLIPNIDNLTNYNFYRYSDEKIEISFLMHHDNGNYFVKVNS